MFFRMVLAELLIRRNSPLLLFEGVLLSKGALGQGAAQLPQPAVLCAVSLPVCRSSRHHRQQRTNDPSGVDSHHQTPRKTAACHPAFVLGPLDVPLVMLGHFFTSSE
jgi:hypothetical protein